MSRKQRCKRSGYIYLTRRSTLGNALSLIAYFSTPLISYTCILRLKATRVWYSKCHNDVPTERQETGRCVGEVQVVGVPSPGQVLPKQRYTSPSAERRAS
jgi:hypothetical protein